MRIPKSVVESPMVLESGAKITYKRENPVP